MSQAAVLVSLRTKEARYFLRVEPKDSRAESRPGGVRHCGFCFGVGRTLGDIQGVHLVLTAAAVQAFSHMLT